MKSDSGYLTVNLYYFLLKGVCYERESAFCGVYFPSIFTFASVVLISFLVRRVKSL